MYLMNELVGGQSAVETIMNEMNLDNGLNVISNESR